MHVKAYISFLYAVKKLKGSSTHPRFINKYVFMRIHITGSKGTNGQMNPTADTEARYLMPSSLPI